MRIMAKKKKIKKRETKREKKVQKTHKEVIEIYKKGLQKKSFKYNNGKSKKLIILIFLYER